MINKAMIDALLAMPDERLLSMLSMLLSSSGMSLPKDKMDAVAVKKLRALLTEVTDSDIRRATELISAYTGGGRRG